MPSPPAAYDGLYELSAECWRCCAETVYMASASVPRIPIVGNAPGVFDDIRWFLENLLNSVSGWTISSWIREIMLPMAVPYLQQYIMDPFQNLISGIRDDVVSILSFAAALIQNPVQTISSLIGQIRDGFPLWLQSALAAGLGLLLNPFQAVSNVLTWAYQSLPAWIRDPLTRLAAYVHDRLWSLEASLRGHLAALRTGIATAIHNAVLNIQAKLAWIQALATWTRDSLPGYLVQIGMNAVHSFWNLLVAGLYLVVSQIVNTCKILVGTALTVGTPLIKSLWAGVTTIPATYLTWLSATCGTDLALTPSRALTSVSGLYGISIAAGSAAHLLSTALNLVPTLNWVGASQLSAFVAEAAAFGPLTQAAYGTLINDAIRTPMRYHWNKQLRPNLPPLREVVELERKRVFGAHVTNLREAYDGLPDYWANIDDPFIWREPNLRQIMQICASGFPAVSSPGDLAGWFDKNVPNWQTSPMAWVTAKLKLAGFRNQDIPPLLEAVRQRTLAPTTALLKTPVSAMLREGYWSEAAARATLEPYGVTAVEVHQLAVAADLVYLNSYLDDQVEWYVALFRKDAINEGDLSLALTTIYVKPERVAQVVARERVRKLPNPKPVAAPKEDPNVTRLRTQAVDSWIKQYRAWAIGKEDLLLGLTIVLRDHDLAEKLIKVEVTRFRPAPPKPPPPPEDPVVANSRRQAIASWVAAFRDGKIVASELELYLEPLIPDKTSRVQLVQLEQLRYAPNPAYLPAPVEDSAIAKVRAEYVRGHIEMFAKRLIDVDQLYQDLLADGLTEALARATTITQATQRIKIPGIDSPYYLSKVLADLIDAGQQAYEAEYMTDQISLAQYRAWLLTLTADGDVVTYLADVLALRKFTESTAV